MAHLQAYRSMVQRCLNRLEPGLFAKDRRRAVVCNELAGSETNWIDQTVMKSEVCIPQTTLLIRDSWAILASNQRMVCCSPT